MFEENVRNTCWRERYIRDDAKRKHQCLRRMLETLVGGRGTLGMMFKRKHQCLRRMLETLVGGRGTLGMMLRGSTNVWGEC